MTVTVAITGASGAIYAHRLLLALEDDARVETIYVIVSKSGEQVWEYELPNISVAELSSKITMLSNDDFFSSVASGSSCSDAMVVVPCSVGTAARVASGISSSLIERACDVELKERKTLIMVIRETPLSLIHLRNLVTLSEAGAVILPASPSFYSRPEAIEDVVDTVTERILDNLGLKNNKFFRWNKE